MAPAHMRSTTRRPGVCQCILSPQNERYIVPDSTRTIEHLLGCLVRIAEHSVLGDVVSAHDALWRTSESAVLERKPPPPDAPYWVIFKSAFAAIMLNCFIG